MPPYFSGVRNAQIRFRECGNDPRQAHTSFTMYKCALPTKAKHKIHTRLLPELENAIQNKQQLQIHENHITIRGISLTQGTPQHPHKTMNPEKIAKLLKQRDQLNERIKSVQAQERRAARRADTRRKIIIGAIADSHMEKNPASDFAHELRALLHKTITKPNDRAALGLKPLTKEENTENESVI